MTYQECILSEQFKIFFQEEVALIETHRTKILQDHPGAKLKAHPYGRIKSAKNMNPEWMGNEFGLIELKKSSCGVNDHEWISDFVRKVCWRTAMYYDKLEKMKENFSAIAGDPQEFEDAPKKKTRKKLTKKNETV